MQPRSTKDQINPGLSLRLDERRGSRHPGRFRTPDGGKAAAEDTDWHEARETAFLARVAEVTLKTVAASTPADLVLAADPRSLGTLRGLLAGEGSIRLIAEVHRDLAHQSVPLIEEAITRV